MQTVFLVGAEPSGKCVRKAFYICFTKDISVNYPLEDSVYIRFMGIIEDKNRFDNGK